MAKMIETETHVGHAGHIPSRDSFRRRLVDHENPHTLFLWHISNPENIRPYERGRKCGDGRDSEHDGKLSRFGADGGYALGVLALNRAHELGLTPVQIVDAVINASEGKFYIHSDEVTQKTASETEDETLIGCAHLANAAAFEHAPAYGVAPEDVRMAIAYMKHEATVNPDKVDMEILKGPHKEKGVIVNWGTERKIRHGDGFNQWFVVGSTRDHEYAGELFERLRTELPQLDAKNVSLQDFLRTLDRQTEASGRILAAGLPLYHVNLDGELPVIERGKPF